jgi:hypothetical protein
MCNAGFDNCNSGNPEPVDGCERPVSMDVSNCGMCGKSCPVPMNATSAACANSLCGVGMCKPNFGDCNKLGADGCEANLLTDSANCTKCGMACPPKDHATGKCNNGVCGLGGCEAGWADCNNNPGDGCEIEIAKRVDHCGKCFTPCPAVANGTAACENSQCKVNTCNGGFADCNKVYGDGCEVTLASSSANCGMCGKVCPGNMPVCNGGNCTALFMFSGVRNDVPIASLAGWTECYKDTFAGGQSLGTVMANCSRANILLGCRMINSNTLRVAAHAPRADVFFDTGQNTNVTRVVNGVGWYYNPNQSWGYANGNDPVQKSACDINDAANPTLRLCIHTGGGNMGSGYRCGMDRLNGNNQWERVIYHAN